ncbi:hypothetical protein MPER_08737 [Moniliophthora perniciosa FA553]|nr:hypothetical protein MPER_08737 [Moniliophthora perniciosa FA553]
MFVEQMPEAIVVDSLRRGAVVTTQSSIQLDPRSTYTIIPANFTGCNGSVGLAFSKTLDSLHESTAYVGALLEHGVRVLIYVGTYDWICNWVGNERWTLALEWSGQEQFVKQELRDWLVDEKRAGRTRSWGNFTFATVDAAGHMVPYDKPKESLELVKRWLAKKEL